MSCCRSPIGPRRFTSSSRAAQASTAAGCPRSAGGRAPSRCRSTAEGTSLPATPSPRDWRGGWLIPRARKARSPAPVTALTGSQLRPDRGTARSELSRAFLARYSVSQMVSPGRCWSRPSRVPPGRRRRARSAASARPQAGARRAVRRLALLLSQGHAGDEQRRGQSGQECGAQPAQRRGREAGCTQRFHARDRSLVNARSSGRRAARRGVRGFFGPHHRWRPASGAAIMAIRVDGPGSESDIEDDDPHSDPRLGAAQRGAQEFAHQVVPLADRQADALGADGAQRSQGLRAGPRPPGARRRAGRASCCCSTAR